MRNGAGYGWSSERERAAMAVFAGPFATDELPASASDDLPGAMAQVVIASVGGDASQLADRQRLEAPAGIEAAGWRFAAPGLSGWVAVYVGARTSASREGGDVFFIVLLTIAISDKAEWYVVIGLGAIMGLIAAVLFGMLGGVTLVAHTLEDVDKGHIDELLN